MIIACMNSVCSKVEVFIDIHNDAVFCPFCQNSYGKIVGEIKQWQELKDNATENVFKYTLPRIGITILVSFVAYLFLNLKYELIPVDFIGFSMFVIFFFLCICGLLIWRRGKSFFPEPDHPQKYDIRAECSTIPELP